MISGNEDATSDTYNQLIIQNLNSNPKISSTWFDTA